MPKTEDEIASEAAAAVEKELEAGGGEEEVSGEAEKPKPVADASEDDFKDDDLDPEKIEAGIAAKTLTLDNAGLLKRFKKVHSALKNEKKWRAETEPKLTVREKQAEAVDRLLGNLQKFRSKDAPDKQSFLEDLIETLLDEKGTPNWAEAKAEIEKILAAAGGGAVPQGAVATAMEREMKDRLERLEKERESEKQERQQSELNTKVAKAYSELPKELDKLPEFKGIPWKNKELKDEFFDLLDAKVLAWSTANEEKVGKGELPPFIELAKSVAKVYLRGGSDTLQKQVANPKPGGLNRSSGPSGSQTRKLPDPKDRDAEDAYLQELANSVAD